MQLEETDAKMTSADFSFTIYTGNRCLIVAASSQEEKGKWMEDIWKAISASATREDEPIKSIYSSLKSNSELITLKRKFEGWFIGLVKITIERIVSKIAILPLFCVFDPHIQRKNPTKAWLIFAA